jgi:uncharacterized membrane protein
MAVMRTNRFAWKDIACIALFGILVALAIRELYGAWLFHAVATPRWLMGLSAATLADAPGRFWIGVTGYALAFIVLSVSLWLMVFDLCYKTLSVDTRQARPSLGDAIRQAAEQR